MRSFNYKHFHRLFYRLAGRVRPEIDLRLGYEAPPMRNLHGFLKERKAMVAIEFAFVGPALLFMIFEIFQSALFVYNSSALNSATQVAARQIMTGAVQNASLTQTQFLNNTLCPLLPAAMPCSNVIVNLQTFSESAYPGGFYNFVNSTQTAIIIPPLDNTQTSFCPGGSGQYVYIQILYAMPLLGTFWLPGLTTTFQGQTVALVTAAAAFKNEPYQSSYTPPAGC
jgi:Flp pilus assembly protein TadG